MDNTSSQICQQNNNSDEKVIDEEKSLVELLDE